MMDNLQQYFKSNKAYIRDSEENLPYGDESRFEERWEALSRDRIRFRSGLKRRKKPLWKVVAFPVLASLALIFGVRFLMRPIMTQPEPVRAVASDAVSPGSIYRDYCRSVADITVELAVLTAYMDEEDAEEAMRTLDEIVYEPVPLIDQLEEVDDARQTEILREYSARQLKTLDDFMNNFKQTMESSN